MTVYQQILSVGRADQMETKVVAGKTAATQIPQERGIVSIGWLCFSHGFTKIQSGWF